MTSQIGGKKKDQAINSEDINKIGWIPITFLILNLIPFWPKIKWKKVVEENISESICNLQGGKNLLKEWQTQRPGGKRMIKLTTYI